MADIDTSGGGKHKKGPGVKKGKKLSTRIDLTPMVDLGFLLITFFIFTTTMSSPTALKLPLPDDRDPSKPNQSKESGTLSLVLAKNNQVFYYEGSLKSDGSNFKSTNYTDLRKVIMNKKATTNEKDLVVVIKPNAESNYNNLVRALDEMLINDIKVYALVDTDKADDAFAQKSGN